MIELNLFIKLSLLSSTSTSLVLVNWRSASNEAMKQKFWPTKVASSKFLIRKLSGLRFFFCFFQRTHLRRSGLRMTYALLMELYGLMVFETIYSSPSYLMALLGGDPS